MLLIAASLAHAEPLVPLERDFTIRAWRKEHGLPDNRVLSLLVGQSGFVWAGNAVRHAQATLVTLRVRIESDQLVIEIQDDGRGFDVVEAERRAGSADRALGLVSMRERMTALGGRCHLNSQLGRGTTVSLSVPLPG